MPTAIRSLMRPAGVVCGLLLVYTACSSSAAVPVEESVPAVRGERVDARTDTRVDSRDAARVENTPASAGPAPGQPMPGWQGSGQPVAGFGAPLGAPTGGAAGTAAAAAPAAAEQGAGGAQASGSSSLSQLFYKIQVLEREVQDLRGLVEEQNHQIERLARNQQEQYLDLDRRMQEVRSAGGGSGAAGGAGAGAASRGAGAGTVPAPQSSAPEPSTGAQGAPAGEREAYSQAFNLMKEREFDASAAAFNRLIEQYPNGSYTPNAYYWLGELHLAQDDNEQARQSFAQVVNLYPDHQKVADALYKLGVVYHRLGDRARARQYLEQVRTEYPGTSAAGLAQTYLAELP